MAVALTVCIQVDTRLSINGAVLNGVLRMAWAFHAEDRASMQQFADGWVASLSRVVATGADTSLARRTPSDWPLSGLTQVEMDRVLSRVPASHRDGSMMRLTPLQVP